MKFICAFSVNLKLLKNLFARIKFMILYETRNFLVLKLVLLVVRFYFLISSTFFSTPTSK